MHESETGALAPGPLALPLRIKAVAIGTAWLSLAFLAAGTMPAPPWAVWAVLVAAVTCTVFMLRIGTVRD